MIIDHCYSSSSLRVSAEGGSASGGETLSFEEAADFNPQSSIELMTISPQDPGKA